MGRNIYGRKAVSFFRRAIFTQILRHLAFFFIIPAFLSVPLRAESAPSAENKTDSYKQLGFSGVDSPRVVQLREKYQTTQYKWLFGILDNAEPYRIYVRNEIEKRGLPPILEYLPVVESNYIPTAKSKSGATGMWQFMLNSVKPFLQCDDYVDERLDPWKSTQAALSKLKENYDMFGDWLLAITAYNCGAGAMQRAVKKAGSRDFWYLSENGFLSAQAAGYVPKLLAVADAVENAGYYGIPFPSARDSAGKTIDMRAGEFDYITVKKSVSIRALARELRIDEDELIRLNLALVQGCTPPHKEYEIRLPEGMKASAEYALHNLND